MNLGDDFGYPVCVFADVDITELEAEGSYTSFLSSVSPRFLATPSGADFYPVQVVITGNNILTSAGSISAELIDGDGYTISGAPIAYAGNVNLARSTAISQSANRIADGTVIGVKIRASADWVAAATLVTVFVYGYLREAI